MSGCPGAFDLSRFVDGEFTSGERRALESHLAECARCHATVDELRSITLALARDPIVEHVDLAPLVLRRAALPPTRTRWAGRAVTAMAACAALLTGIGIEGYRRGSRDEAGFQARGGSESPDKWVAIHPYLVGAAGAPRPLARDQRLPTYTVPCGDRLLFAYDNGGPHPYRRLSIVGQEQSGAVHWFFPENGDGGSIAAEVGSGRELHEEVPLPRAASRAKTAPPWMTDGEMPPPRAEPRSVELHLFAIFSDEPLSKGTIESALLGCQWWENRLPIPGTAQHSLELSLGSCAR